MIARRWIQYGGMLVRSDRPGLSNLYYSVVSSMAPCLSLPIVHSAQTLSQNEAESDETEDEATGERTTRVGRPRGGMKVAARSGERLRKEIARSRGRVTTFAPHGGRTAPLAAGARLIAAPTPRRRHLARRGAALRRRQNGRELAARPRQQKQQRLNFSFSSRLVLSQAHTRATCARVAAFAPRRIRTGSQPARRRRAAAKCTTLTSLRCCCFGTS